MKSVPIPTLHLFAPLDAQLIELLRSLTAAEWNNRTLAKQWTVKDIASHLLDGNVRMISMFRDGYFGDKPGQINSYQELVDFLNQLNADWVKATKRMSPPLLTDLLEQTGKEYIHELAKLDLFAPALFSVAWAGEDESANWFHMAREYTEKWHHQKQIREATERSGLMEREFFFPLIDTFMRALPHTYRNVSADKGATVSVRVTGDAGGNWTIRRGDDRWSFSESESADTVVTVDPDTAWKLFTKGISKDDAAQKIRFSGNEALGKPILSMLSVMA